MEKSQKENISIEIFPVTVMRILTLKLVTRGEQSSQMAGEVLADNNEAIRGLLAFFYFTARICTIKGLENFFKNSTETS